MQASRNHILIQRWHRFLGLPQHTSTSWYRARLHEELHELRAAHSRLERLSEAADVLYILSRAQHDGHPLMLVPRSRLLLPVRVGPQIHAYMLAKYTLRWGFFRVLAALSGAPRGARVREVVNPRKESKLALVAARHGLNVDRFVRVARWLRCVWPLLP